MYAHPEDLLLAHHSHIMLVGSSASVLLWDMADVVVEDICALSLRKFYSCVIFVKRLHDGGRCRQRSTSANLRCKEDREAMRGMVGSCQRPCIATLQDSGSLMARPAVARTESDTRLFIYGR